MMSTLYFCSSLRFLGCLDHGQWTLQHCKNILHVYVGLMECPIHRTMSFWKCTFCIPWCPLMEEEDLIILSTFCAWRTLISHTHTVVDTKPPHIKAVSISRDCSRFLRSCSIQNGHKTASCAGLPHHKKLWTWSSSLTSENMVLPCQLQNDEEPFLAAGNVGLISWKRYTYLLSHR